MLKRSRILQGAMTLCAAAMLLAATAKLAAADAPTYMADAQKYLEKGDAKSAVIQLKNALQADPGHIEARLLLAALYVRLADGLGAEKEFKRAGQLGAATSQWVPGLAQALALQNDFAGLLEQVQPDSSMNAAVQASILGLRGHAHLALQQIEEAVAAYDQALALDAQNGLARLGKARVLVSRQDWEAARTELDRLIEAFPDLAEARIERGDVARIRGDLQTALDDFAKAIALAPNNVRGYVGHGMTAMALQQTDLVMADVTEMRRRFGEVPFASYLHALAAFAKRDLDTAAEQLQLVLRANPGHLQAQFLFGVVSYGKGDYRLADEYLSRIAGSVPGSAGISKVLGATRLKLKDSERAIAVLLPAVEASPQDAQLLALLGNAYMQQGDHSKASDYLARAVELSPDQAGLRTQLALGRLATGDTDSAISNLESAVELDQDLLQADILLVLSYLTKKEYASAIEAAGALGQRMPDSPIPHNLTGLAYLAGGQLEQADAAFAKALEKDPDFVVGLMNRARVALAGAQPDAARAYYQAVLAKQSDHLGAMLAMASLAQQAGDATAAESWLERARKARPDALQPVLSLVEQHLRRGDVLKATNLLAGLTSAQAGQAAALRLKGMAQLQSGDFSSAVRTLTQLVEAQPEAVEAWFQLARAQAAAGDMAASRSSFGRAAALDGANSIPLVWIGLAELELRAQDYPAALAVSKDMQARFPGNAMAFELEAAAHRARGAPDKALLAMEQAVRAEGTTKRINLFAHSLVAAGQTDRAVLVLRDWLAAQPEDATSWSTLGMLLQQAGRDAEAIAAYEKALEVTSDNPLVLNNVAWLYHQKGDPRALEHAKRGYEIAPERAEIVDTYGWILLQQGQKQAGLQILQQALVAAPRNPEIALHVAEALALNGRNPEARQLLQRVMREHAGTQWAGQAEGLTAKLQ